MRIVIPFSGMLCATALAALTAGFATPAAAAPPAAALAAWHAEIARTAVPGTGCFHAAFPSTQWQPVACIAAPLRPYLPRNGHGAQTTGNGHDYAAVTATLTGSALGSFPAVSGVKSEHGYGGGANIYSLQLNSGFMHTAGCNGGGANCLTWEQFVYSSSSQAAFMQYWLINYGNRCPSGGWMSYSGSCYKNSAAVGAPQEAITQLGNLSVTGSAVRNGTDTMTFTTATNAYTTTGADSVVDLATAWTQSEYNVVGDGGGSAAKFNRGSHVTVGIALADGSSAAPQCAANDGTTGETNNLNLGSCGTSGGGTPSIGFTESN